MKIALLGNTCGNNFALMRYLVDLGADAHLLLYSNEGVSNSNPQYNPEWDTWEYDKWSDRVHRLSIPNGIEPIIGRPDKLKRRISKGRLIDIFSGYDCFIGSGISPSIFARISKKLTIFYPYSTGVEWVGEREFSKKLNNISLETPFRNYIKKKQIEGIRTAKICAFGGDDETKNIFLENDIKITKIHVPQYYNLEESIGIKKDGLIRKILDKVEVSDFVIFSHMRHHWVHDKNIYSKHDFSLSSKHNEWLIIGFSNFVRTHPKSKPLLILVDWGKDSQKSKDLIRALGLQKYIFWTHLLKRKQIIALINYCDIGVGEFLQESGALWGSTGWEVIACGKPLLQTLNFSKIEWKETFGFELPRILDVKSDEDVFTHLCHIYADYSYKNRIGEFNKKWFNKYNGISLAKKWLKILEENC